MLNDARVASLGIPNTNVCTTRINKEKKFKIKFQVLLKFAQILPDYLYAFGYTFCGNFSAFRKTSYATHSRYVITEEHAFTSSVMHGK